MALKVRTTLAGCKVLVTAGPTHEPIDAVRYLGNRSSGRVGVEIAHAACTSGAAVRLLLGPTKLMPPDSQIEVHRFQSTSDLERLLIEHQPWCDVLVMAAAVADFRPVVTAEDLRGKWKRERSVAAGGRVALELEPTPDLLAGCAKRRAAQPGLPPHPMLVGFALEPRPRLMESARAKLSRKGIEYIVANPLESMEGSEIEATILGRDGSEHATGGPVDKAVFGRWFVDWLASKLPKVSAS